MSLLLSVDPFDVAVPIVPVVSDETFLSRCWGCHEVESKCCCGENDDDDNDN